jgi:hypothetical protein
MQNGLEQSDGSSGERKESKPKWKMSSTQTYRSDAVRAYDKVHGCGGTVRKHRAYAIIFEILQRNQLLVELDQPLRDTGSQRFLQNKPPDSAGLVLVIRIVRDPRIDNLARVSISDDGKSPRSVLFITSLECASGSTQWQNPFSL